MKEKHILDSSSSDDDDNSSSETSVGDRRHKLNTERSLNKKTPNTVEFNHKLYRLSDGEELARLDINCDLLLSMGKTDFNVSTNTINNNNNNINNINNNINNNNVKNIFINKIHMSFNHFNLYKKYNIYLPT